MVCILKRIVLKMKNNGKVIKKKKKTTTKNVNLTSQIREFKHESYLIYITTKTYFKTISLSFYHSNWFCNLFMCITQNTEINSYNSFSLVIDQLTAVICKKFTNAAKFSYRMWSTFSWKLKLLLLNAHVRFLHIRYYYYSLNRKLVMIKEKNNN